MRVLVTGASGHIGSAVVPELIKAGHQVTGLARSDAAAAAVTALGARVRRGDLYDTAGLREAAAAADAVVHLAFDHETMFAGDFPAAAAADLAVAQAFGDALAGTGKTLIGVGVKPTGDAHIDAVISANPRSAGTRAIAGLTERGVRAIIVAIPPVTHSDQDKRGFIPILIKFARDAGVSAYVGDGANRWPAGHTLDVASLYRLALDKAPAGAQLFAAT
jgi:nucleoside-diphosphate-sugar epimerase